MWEIYVTTFPHLTYILILNHIIR